MLNDIWNGEGVFFIIEFDKIADFQSLYKAHTVARRGKRTTREVIEFEMNLSDNLIRISEELKNGTYNISGYYNFEIYDPKYRVIHALHYRDRVVQHCLCDEVLVPLIDKKLIFDNSACRIGKGTHFAIKRISYFLNSFYKQNGVEGYFLKCDIRKFFDNIDHKILKGKLLRIISDEQLLTLLFHIIDSYEVAPGKGIPLGNQTSQWFAVYYLDGFDRMIKEKLQLKYYSRYMDDGVIIHSDKDYLKHCLKELTSYLENELNLSFNEKTEIFPLKNGVNYLGWHIYLSDSGKIIRKISQQTKYKFKRNLKKMCNQYSLGEIELSDIKQVVSSYKAHLSHGHTYKLMNKCMSSFVLKK